MRSNIVLHHIATEQFTQAGNYDRPAGIVLMVLAVIWLIAALILSYRK